MQNLPSILKTLLGSTFVWEPTAWKFGFHIFWCSFVFPVFSSFFFLFAKYLRDTDYGLVKSIGASALGAGISLFFLIFPGVCLAVATFPMLYLKSKVLRHLSICLSVFLYIIFVLPGEDVYYRSEWHVVILIVVVFMVATAFFYRAIGVSPRLPPD